MSKIVEKKENVMERQYNLDVLRIISMIMVIILHFNLNGGFLSNAELAGTITQKYVLITEFLCIGSVNIFILLSGYFSVNSEFKFRKILKMELQLISYSVIIYFIAIAFGIAKFSKEIAICSLFPLITARYWFITSYIGLYLLTPFINMLLKKLTKTQYKYLIIVLVFLFSIIVSIYPNNSYTGSGNGYNILWFIVLYAIGGYLRLHFNKKVKKSICVILIILIVAIQMFIKIYLNNTPIELINTISKYSLSYSNILNLILALAFFMLFKDIKIKGKITKVVIKNITPLLLGVFLFHCHFSISGWIWNTWLKPIEYINIYNILLVELLDIVTLFAIGCGIEFIRVGVTKFVYKKLKLNHYVEKIDNKMQSIITEHDANE